MSDYKKPRTNLNNFLPDQLRSALLKNLNENLFNRYLTKDEFVHTVGIIGDSDSTSAYKQIKEPTSYRQESQLQPVISATVGTDTQYLSFSDFMERLSRLGVDITKYDDWGKALQFNLVPPIDLDKIINYRNYYWSSSDNTEIPDYITIKNQKNWAEARSYEFKKMVTSIQPSYTIVVTDQYNAYIVGNQLSIFSQGDQILLSTGSTYYTNTINSITLNPTTGRTVINFTDPVTDANINSIYSLYLSLSSISISNNQFVVNGDWSKLFINGYIFLAPKQNNNQNTLFSVASSEYVDNTTDKTFITVNEKLPTNASWTRISLFPMISVTEQEYNSVNGDNAITYNTLWSNKFLGSIIWDRELKLVTSYNGYSNLGDHGIYDNSVNFVSSLIRPGDYLQINNGPITGKYLIISVQDHFLGIDSSVRMFSKTQISYNIEREYFYDYFLSDTAPNNPSLYDYWSNSTNDTLNQWNGSNWVNILNNISLLVNSTHQRYKLSLEQSDSWSSTNKWIHKNQITSYSGKTRAQLPIIEFDPFLELSYTSKASYEWQYRKNSTDLYSDLDNEPNLFEISDIRISDGDEFLFVNYNTLVLNQKYGNLTDTIVAGSTIKLSGFVNNNGIYDVVSSSYKQPTPSSRFCTYVVLKQQVDNPFDLPLNAIIGPEKTSMGDTWLGYDAHWIFYGMKDINASSVGPEVNPALSVFVKSIKDTVTNFESNIGLAWQTYSYTVDNVVAPLINLDSSLHDLVLYDDYQEGDIRVYINDIRQYGNFQDIQSSINPDFIGAIKFDSSVILNKEDLLRIELGEYALNEVGRRSVKVKSNKNLVDSSLPYDLVNLTYVRKLEQDKQVKNEYPYFTIYDINGIAKDIASRIFVYQENSSYEINPYILRRIVYNSDTSDYGFVQELSDSVTGELYSYKNFSQPNYPLQTVWKRGLNNEQYQPSKLDDGSWDIPNPWFYNINHELRNDLMYSDLYKHFASILNAQSVPGLIKSTAMNQVYVDDNINYGVAGTIKEHNTGLDVLISSVFVNNVNPIDLIQFAHDRYIGSFAYIQEEFIDTISNYLLDITSTDMQEVSDAINNAIIYEYESNSKFDSWFGDSTTFNDITKTGIKNWIATLPYLNLTDKVNPYLIIDSDLKLCDVVCHDGHKEHIVIQNAIVQKLNNYLIKNGAIKQTVNTETAAYPTGVVGSILIRTNTNANTIRTYRYSVSGIWEEFEYNTLLAKTILSIESKLYQNCPDVDLIYDYSTVISDSRYNSLMNTQFSNYMKQLNTAVPLINSYYKTNDPFSWNYEFTVIQQHPKTGSTSYDTRADYHSLYELLYGTAYPHREPWKLQSYVNKPLWWDSQYLDTTGNRVWSSLMWFNITNGIVPSGNLLPDNKTIASGLPNQVQTFIYIPVNMDSINTLDGYLPDDLLPPYWDSSNTTNTKIRTPYDAKLNESIVTPNLDFTFGDGNINEWLWKQSAQYNYDILMSSFRIDPLNFTNVTFNGNKFTKINCLDVDPLTSKVFSHSDTVFHGDVVNDEVYKSNGFNQWYINYNRYFGYDGDASQFQTFWKNWDTNLSYMFGSFIDKSGFSISNSTFDMTTKDYNIGVKKTVGFTDMWADSLRATILSVPSKYSTTRDNGIGWTVQFDTSSPINQNINYYPKENFDFRAVRGSNTFEIYTYDLINAGIILPITYVELNYNQQLDESSTTNYIANALYSASVTVDANTINLSFKGSSVSTVDDVLTYLNDKLDTYATAYISSGNMFIQSNGSSLSIVDNGMFASLSSHFGGMEPSTTTSYSFDKSFDISGNLTNIFIEGGEFTITDSTQFNGTYTIKSVYYDISNSLTKIFIDEDVTVTSDVIDGLVRPAIRRTLPDTWVTGTEIYLSTMGTLPSPFNEFRPYFLIRLTDYTFQLSLTSNGYPVSALTSPSGQMFAGRIKYTFKANNGDVTNYTWRQHYSDTREVLSYAQPIYISGIQQIIDFIDGYSDYLSYLGFDSKTTDIFNTENGITITWQTETENFIDDLYIARSTNQNNNLEFSVKVDLENSRFIYIDSNVSLAANQSSLVRVVLIPSAGGKLPDPISNPLKEYIPYYAIPSNDGLGFQIAYSQSDAIKGNYIKLTDIGSGSISFKLYNSGNTYQQYWINPYRNAMKINHPQGILSNVIENDRNDILTNQKIYDTNGVSLNPKTLYVLREDESSQIFLTDETKASNANGSTDISIAGIHAFLDSYEHILTFNDETITGDLIYDPFFGIRTPRFIVEFDRQINYTLRPNVGGYFVYNDNLVQNFESSVDDLRYMNDAYNSLESKPLIKYLRKSVGYNGQQSYLQNLNINAKSDFIFWRGMIRNKGTNFAIDAYTNQTVFNDADLDEFWAYKIATFGDSKEKSYVEMRMQRADSIQREARYEFVNPEENASDETFVPIAITDRTRWYNQPDAVSALSPDLSFYFNASVTSINYNQQTNIQYLNNRYLLVLSKNADGVVISYFDPVDNKTKTLVNQLDYIQLNKNIIQFIVNYNPATLSNLTVSTLSYNYNAHNPIVFVDKKAGIILDQIEIWNPEQGQHYLEAYSLIDYKLATDPAVYDVDFTGNIYNNVWKDNNQDKVWIDMSALFYIPYDDISIFPDVNDRIDNWGKLADNGSLKLYQWTKSTVLPSDYTTEYPNNGTPRQLLYKNNGTYNNPIWQLLTVTREQYYVSLITTSTASGIGGTVRVYKNGKYDLDLNLSNYRLYDYVYGGLVPNQTEKPNINDRIIIETILPTPSSDDLNNLVYKYDTPYSVEVENNATDGVAVTYYYYWVNGRTDLVKSVTNYQSTIYQAEKDLINNPNPFAILSNIRYFDDGYGVNYGNVFDGTSYNLPIRYTQLIIRGLKGLVTEEDRYALRFIRDFTLRDRMPFNADMYDYSTRNPVTTPLSLKNKHVEWKLFREKQSQKVDQYLWDKLISALIGYNISNQIIDTSTQIPSLDRVLYDDLYDAGSRYGLADDQIFVDPTIGINTIMSMLTDPTRTFTNIDIVSFLSTYNFNTVNDIVATMYAIYESFDATSVNAIYFSVLSDAMALKKESPDFFKTSWVALDISQNVSTTIQSYSNIAGNLISGGMCDIDENIVVPTQPPLPSPSPTPSFTPSITPTFSPTITPTITPTISISPSFTITPTLTFTPTVTITPTLTFTPTNTVTATATVTPTVTSTATVTPSISGTPGITYSPTPSPTLSPIGNTCYDTIVLNANPLVYYKLDDLGTNIARDFTNQGRDGFYQGNIIQGNAGLFSTSVRSIEFPNDFNQNNFIYSDYYSDLNMPYDFTFEIQSDANLADQNAAIPVLVNLAYNSQSLQPQFQLSIDPSTGKFVFEISTSDMPSVSVMSNTVADGTPHLITCKRQNDVIHIFIDGREEASTPVTGTNNVTDQSGVMLGGTPYQIPSLYNYVGGMDCFSLYNVALSDSDIASRYECIAGITISPSPTPTPTPTPSVTNTPSPTPSVTPTLSLTPTVSHQPITFTMVSSADGSTVPNNTYLAAQCVPVVNTGNTGLTCAGASDPCAIGNCAPSTGINYFIRPSGGNGPYTVTVTGILRNEAVTDCLTFGLGNGNSISVNIQTSTQTGTLYNNGDGTYGPLSIIGDCGNSSALVDGTINLLITDALNYTQPLSINYSAERIYPSNPVNEAAPQTTNAGCGDTSVSAANLAAIGNPYYLYVQDTFDGATANTEYYMERDFDITTAGTYTFKVYHDDAGWVYVDGNLVYSSGTALACQSENMGQFTVNLSAGTHQIVLKYENVPANTPGYFVMSMYDPSNNLFYITRKDGWLSLTTTTGVQ